MRLGKIHRSQWNEGAMSKAARSVFLFSIYLLVMGAVLTVAPNLLLVMFGLPTTEEVYIRILGMLVFVLGFYYLKAAQSNLTSFIRWTVYGRLAGFFMFCLLAIGGFGPLILILFGIVDAASALWTYHCIKRPDIA